MIHSVNSTQFDEFEESMRGVDGGFLQVGRSTLDWDLRVLDLGPIKLMDGHNGANVIYHGACEPESFGLFVPAAQLQRLKVNGIAMTQHSAAWLVPSCEFRVPSSAGMVWLGISIDRQAMHDWPEVDEHHLQAFCCAPAAPATIERITDLASAAFRSASSDSHPLSDPRAIESLRAQFLDAMHGLLQSMHVGQRPSQGRPKIRRGEAIDHVVRLMQEQIDQPIQVKDLCAHVGVSVATLQNMFAEQFGISPYRYLMLRRLHAIHKALRAADPSDNVSSICARFGVWDFGRFSSQYQRTFNVRPSQTLGQRAPRANAA